MCAACCCARDCASSEARRLHLQQRHRTCGPTVTERDGRLSLRSPCDSSFTVVSVVGGPVSGPVSNLSPFSVEQVGYSRIKASTPHDHIFIYQ
jgi:hypothetical protein